jgi:hypothetical protein
MSINDRADRLIELVRQHELYFAAEAQERPDLQSVMRTFLRYYWDPFYEHFVGLSEPDVSVRFSGLANELSRLRAIAAYNGISTPDMGTSQHGYVESSGDVPVPSGPTSRPIHPTARFSRGSALITSGANMSGTPAFIGKKYDLVNTATVLAPGAGGLTVKFSLEGTHLVADVCIDGKCYRGAADLSGLRQFSSQVADAALAHWKANSLTIRKSVVTTPRGGRFGDRRPRALVGNWLGEGELDLSGVRARLPRRDRHHHHDDMLRDHVYAVKAAGTALVGAIADQHAHEFCAGWWHSLTHDIESGVKGIEHGLGGILKGLKGPIMAAATALAASVGIPPSVVQGLTSTLLDAVTGVGQVKAAAKAALAKAEANPQLAKALAVAKKAVAQSTVAAQAAQTVAQAAQGSPAAAQQVAALAQAAQGGDAAAQAAMALVNQMPGMQQQLAQLQQQLATALQGQAAPAAASTDGGGPPVAYGGGNAQISQPTYQDPNAGNYGGDGSDTSTSGVAGQRAKAVQLAQGSPARVVGVVQTIDGQWAATGFATSDEADDWFGSWLGIPHAYAYVAYFDKGASWPAPENEQFGKSAAAQALTKVSVGYGALMFTPVEFALSVLGAGAAGYWYGKPDDDNPRSRVSGWPALALAAGGGFAAGKWGEEGYDWLRSKWNQHELKKAAG